MHLEPMPAPASAEAANCYHCGQALPRGGDLSVLIEDIRQPMCCRGCQAVAEAIVANGLNDYYRFRSDNPPTARELVPEFLRQTAIYDNPALQKSFVRQEGANLREAALILEGIVCAACVWLNEQHLAKLPGVQSVSVNYATRRARCSPPDGCRRRTSPRSCPDGCSRSKPRP